MIHKLIRLRSSKCFAAAMSLYAVLSVAVIAQEVNIESAQKLFNDGEYEKAIATLNKLLEQDPNNADVHAWMGSALGMVAQKSRDMNLMMQLGMRAMQEFETAVKLDPNNVVGLMGRGMSMLMAPPPFGNVDKGLSDLQKVVELDPAIEDAHFYLGIAHLKKGESEKAKSEFGSVLKLNPDHENARSELAKLAGEKPMPATDTDSKKKHGDGWLEEQNGFLILHLKGTPYDMGYQQGTLMRDIITKMPTDPAQILGMDEQTLSKIREATKKMDKFIPEEFREQMRGVADALETSYEEILLWNTFSDALFVQHSNNPVQQCTNFLALGKATADGKVIHGANLEYGDIIMNRMVTGNGQMVMLAIYEPENGNKFAVVMTYPIMVSGYFGINNAGLSVSQTFLPAKDSTIDGMPMFMLLRKVIQYADDIPGALKIVKETQRTYGTSMMFADGKKNSGAAIEYSATKYAVREPKNGTLLTTNRMADKKLYESMEKGITSDHHEKMMTLREKRYAQMFKAAHGRIDVPEAVGFLRDHLDLSTGENIIMLPAIGSSSVISSAVFRPADLSFWVARGAVPMVYGEFVGFDLKALLAGEKSRVTPERIPRDTYLDSAEFKAEIKKAEEKAGR